MGEKIEQKKKAIKRGEVLSWSSSSGLFAHRPSKILSFSEVAFFFSSSCYRKTSSPFLSHAERSSINPDLARRGKWIESIRSRIIVGTSVRGAWSDRDTNDIFAHSSLIFYYLDFKFSTFVCPSKLHALIWFFLKNSFRKKKNIRKTTQNALAPSIFIVWSIVLKLGTPLLHIQAQNTLLQNFYFRSRSRDMDEKLPKTLLYPTWSGLTKHNFFRRSKLKNL